MQKVLLIQPPLEDFYTTSIRLYPLGLLYTAEVFQQMGLTVRVFDALSPLKKKALPLPKKFFYLAKYLGQPYFFKHYQRFGVSFARILEEIKNYEPDLIGLSSSFAAYFSTLEALIKEIKQQFRIPVIIGGNQATAAPMEIKKRVPEIDEVIAGQAERTLPLLAEEHPVLKGLLKNSPVKSLDGLDWRTLTPAHNLLPASDYQIGRKNYISLQASRGCPHLCSFCNIHLVFGRRPEYRKVKSVLEEMRWNYLYRQVRVFNFEDDNLAFNRDWFEEFLKTVSLAPEFRDIEITFMNGLSYENLDESLLRLMKKAGVRRLDLSWVSGDPVLRRRYQRPEGTEEEKFFELIKSARRLGFFLTVYLIIGLPGQTREEVVETTEKLLEAGVLVGPSVFYLTPGSELEKNLPLSAEIKNDWDFYRSTAFAVETDYLRRQDLIELFLYIRQRNLENRAKE
ncbi:MAG: B12-binding domain-containing radical SAM protein [Candidatus Aminicenantes bacterium]|nr:B12-binding domain-containing radical SAM protein [Candidatus Aminicenantes bacterium]